MNSDTIATDASSGSRLTCTPTATRCLVDLSWCSCKWLSGFAVFPNLGKIHSSLSHSGEFLQRRETSLRPDSTGYRPVVYNNILGKTKEREKKHYPERKEPLHL